MTFPLDYTCDTDSRPCTTPVRRSWITSAFLPSALEYWREAISASLVELEVSSPEPNSFVGAMTTLGDDLVSFSDISATSEIVRRTPTHIRRSSSDAVNLIHLYSGSLSVNCETSSSCLMEGESVLVDSRVPYVLSTKNSHCLSVTISRTWLDASLHADPSAIVGRRIGSTRGWGRALNSTLGELRIGKEGSRPLPLASFAEHIAAILGLLLDPDDPSVSRRGSLYQRLSSLVDRDFADADLSAVALAAREGISTRYVHSLFARHGTSVGQEILLRRVDAARRMLESGDLSIGEVAARCGFSDQNYLARIFKQRFSVTPSEYRRGRLGQPR